MQVAQLIAQQHLKLRTALIACNLLRESWTLIGRRNVYILLPCTQLHIFGCAVNCFEYCKLKVYYIRSYLFGDYNGMD